MNFLQLFRNVFAYLDLQSSKMDYRTVDSKTKTLFSMSHVAITIISYSFCNLQYDFN